MWLLLWIGCVTDTTEVERLRAEVEQLRDESAYQREQIDTLRQQVVDLSVARIEPEADAEPASATGPQCTKVSEGVYQLPPDLTADLETLSRSGRLLLHRGDSGEFDGYRLSAIRRGSTGDSCGFANGDIVHSVNGLALDSMTAAMEAYNVVQEAGSYAFAISRRGSPVTLTLIVPE
ncbi:MAG: hypothetical protein R3F61_09650 [Myxococcota bacterium]